MDVVIHLEVGRMRFLRVPGTGHSSGGTKRNVQTFWAFGIETATEHWAESRLVLVGSLDGLTSMRYPADDAASSSFNFPSDPSFMIELLAGELELDVDLEDYEYETDWCPEDSTNGMAAVTALGITERAREGYSVGGRGWVDQSRPKQRVVAIVSDIHVGVDATRTILARPVLIGSTL